MSRRRGFSLLELIVIIAVVALLAALLTGATRKVRFAAERTRSQNNLMQIGIAIQNYHDGNNQRFPLLVDWSAAGVGAPTNHGVTSLFYNILPQMEQSNVYNLFDWESPTTYYDSNGGTATTYIKAYLSPNDPTGQDDPIAKVEVEDPNPEKEFKAKYTGSYATTSYAANGLVFQPGGGMKTLIDGSTNTILLAERYRVCAKSDKKDDVVYNLWGMGAYGATTPSFATPLPDAEKYPTSKPALEQFVPPYVMKDGGGDAAPAEGEIEGKSGAKDVKFSELVKNSSAACGFQVLPKGDVKCDPRIPQALQATGLLVGLGDASVRTISPKISPNTFWRAVTPAGNEVLGTDW